MYAHLNGYIKKTGDIVNIGDNIAFSGNTGLSTGPHLHIGIQNKDGEFLNPQDYINFSD